MFGSLASEVQWYCMRGLRPTSPSTSTATLRCPFGGRLLQHMTLTRKAAVTRAAAPHKPAHTNEHMEDSDLVCFWFGLSQIDWLCRIYILSNLQKSTNSQHKHSTTILPRCPPFALQHYTQHHSLRLVSTSFAKWEYIMVRSACCGRVLGVCEVNVGVGVGGVSHLVAPTVVCVAVRRCFTLS